MESWKILSCCYCNKCPWWCLVSLDPKHWGSFYIEGRSSSSLSSCGQWKGSLRQDYPRWLIKVTLNWWYLAFIIFLERLVGKMQLVEDIHNTLLSHPSFCCDFVWVRPDCNFVANMLAKWGFCSVGNQFLLPRALPQRVCTTLDQLGWLYCFVFLLPTIYVFIEQK